MKIADILSQVRFYLDEVSPEVPEGAVTNPFWTDNQLCLLINQSYSAFFDMLCFRDKDYGLALATGPVTTTIPLPTGFRAVNQLKVGESLVEFRAYAWLLRNGCDLSKTGSPVAYYKTPTTLSLWPVLATPTTYRLVYTKGITTADYHVLNADDEADYPERDTWLQWVVYDVVNKALKKDRRHDEASAYAQYRAEVEEQISKDILTSNRSTVLALWDEA